MIQTAKQKGATSLTLSTTSGNNQRKERLRPAMAILPRPHQLPNEANFMSAISHLECYPANRMPPTFPLSPSFRTTCIILMIIFFSSSITYIQPPPLPLSHFSVTSLSICWLQFFSFFSMPSLTYDLITPFRD